MKPVAGPWGGSSVFVWQFSAALKRHGYAVQFDLKGDVDVIVLIDPRDDLQSMGFGMGEIHQYRKDNPKVKLLHRINECDKRKGSKFIDDLLEEANAIADHTIFISHWLREYFEQLWFDRGKPHSVVYNGADPTIFHPIGSSIRHPGEPLRIVTHHWSNNPMKGFPVYEELDGLIASGAVKDFELWVIGRWPEHITWKSAKTFAPASGKKLADLLRRCHLYITASLWEPCGMHHVEGAQCGLPLVCHADGGGIVEAGKQYGLVFQENLQETLLEARLHYPELRKQVLRHMPNGELMANQCVRLVQNLMVE